MRTFGATFHLWCYIVRPRGSSLAQFWSVYYVVLNDIWWYSDRARGGHSQKSGRFFLTLLREFRLHLLQHLASTSSSLHNHLCRRGSVSTTGTLGPDEVEMTLSRNKLLESGTSLPYKKLLTMSNTKFFMNAFMWPTLQAVWFSSTRTPSTLTSASNRLPSRNDAMWTTRSYCRIRTWMGATLRSVACFFSSCGSQWLSLHINVFERKKVLPRKSFWSFVLSWSLKTST